MLDVLKLAQLEKCSSSIGLRARATLMGRHRPKGLSTFSYVKMSAESTSVRLMCGKLSGEGEN
jgi:hypothetical protein